MLRISSNDFEQNIEKYLYLVTENSDNLIISTGKGKSVVIMSLEKYYSISATAHEYSSKTNKLRLDSAIEKLRAGNSFSKNLTEL